MTAPGYRLVPCPFCGRAPLIREIEAHSHSPALNAMGIPDHPGSFVVECSCDAGFVRDTESTAAEAWNRRAAAPQPEPPADLVERARVFWNTSPRHLGQIELMAAFAQEHAAELASAEIAANRDNVIEDAILDRDAAEAQAASEKARADKFKQQLDEATIRHSDARRREKAQRDRADKAEKALADAWEACAIVAAIHSKYPIETDYERGYDDGRISAAAAIRARKGGGYE